MDQYSMVDIVKRTVDDALQCFMFMSHTVQLCFEAGGGT
jgi:hypothetical protein